MIAKQRTVASARDAVAYLRFGRYGDAVESERVAWISTRNLPTDDPQLSVIYMEATADLNHRPERKYYSASISFDLKDTTDRALMEEAADHVLKRLGLAEHEVIVVAHKDREHDHFHILANRIHPETGKCWDNGHDYDKTDRALREFEIEKGLHQVPTWRCEPEIQQTIPSLPRASQKDFVEFLRERGVADALKASSSWPELEDRIAAHGLVLQRAGRGLQLTDGEKVAKISALHRKSSLVSLEKRFGETWKAWTERSPTTASEPVTSRPLSAPAPEIEQRAVEASRLAAEIDAHDAGRELAEELSIRHRVVSGDARNARYQLDSADASIRQILKQVLPEHRPSLKSLQVSPPESPPALPFELGRHCGESRVEEIRAAIEGVPAYEKAPDASEDFQQLVEGLIPEGHLKGKRRLLRGDDTDRANAKVYIGRLPDLLEERRHLANRAGHLKESAGDLLNGFNALSARLKKGDLKAPDEVEIYERSRGVPKAHLAEAPERSRAVIGKTREHVVEMWDAAAPAFNGASRRQILESLEPHKKQASRARGTLSAQSFRRAVGELPQAAKRGSKLAGFLAGRGRLFKAVMGRLMPSQLRLVVSVAEAVLGVVRMLARQIEQTWGGIER